MFHGQQVRLQGGKVWVTDHPGKADTLAPGSLQRLHRAAEFDEAGFFTGQAGQRRIGEALQADDEDLAAAHGAIGGDGARQSAASGDQAEPAHAVIPGGYRAAGSLQPG